MSLGLGNTTSWLMLDIIWPPRKSLLGGWGSTFPEVQELWGDHLWLVEYSKWFISAIWTSAAANRNSLILNTNFLWKRPTFSYGTGKLHQMWTSPKQGWNKECTPTHLNHSHTQTAPCYTILHNNWIQNSWSTSAILMKVWSIRWYSPAIWGWGLNPSLFFFCENVAYPHHNW